MMKVLGSLFWGFVFWMSSLWLSVSSCRVNQMWHGFPYGFRTYSGSKFLKVECIDLENWLLIWIYCRSLSMMFILREVSVGIYVGFMD